VEARFPLRGVIAATLTPFQSDAIPDAAKAIPYYAELLSDGCDGLNLLGTTGEGVSIALADRLAFMEAIASSSLPRERLIVGTGAAALGDAIRLTRAAFDFGFAAALVIPPFYYRDASDAGIAAFYGALADAVRPPQARLLLYNFPRMSGITFTPELVAQVIESCGPAIGGVKDSSNEPALESALHARFPQLAIYPGSETLLGDARERGFAGCISGSVCLWPQFAQRVWRDGDSAALDELTRARSALGQPLISAVRRRVSAKRSDSGWLTSALPLR